MRASESRSGARGAASSGLLAAILAVLVLGGAWYGLRTWRKDAQEEHARRVLQEELARRTAGEREAAAKARARALEIEAEMRARVARQRALLEAAERSARAATTPATQPGDPLAGLGPPAEVPAGEVRGSLSKEVIQRIVRQRMGDVKGCYEQGLKAKKDLAGRVVVKLVIGATGAVRSASVESSTLGAPAVEGCIARAARQWGFPAPTGGGIVVVQYPFIFRSAN